MIAFLRSLLFVVFLMVLWVCILVPVIPLAPLCLIILLVRRLEEFVYKTLYGAMHFKIEETPWLHDGPKNRTDINCLVMLESFLDVKTFRNLMTKKLNARDNVTGKPLFPRVTKYVCGGLLNFYWREETNFQLDDHVYEWSSNPCKSKAELEDLISQLAERPLRTDENRSPWEFILCHCKDSDGHKRTSIIFRISHALADGTSLMYFLVNILCKGSGNNNSLSRPEPKKLTEKQKVFLRIKSSLYFPYNIARSLLPKFKQMTSFDCSVSGRKRLIYTKPISLKLIKTIKSRLNVTVNDVLLGCLATSLHNFFRKRNEKTPKNFISCIPIDTRLSIDEAKEFSNKINITQLALPTSSADPVKNIQEVHERMEITKQSLEGMSMRFGLRVAASFTPNFLLQNIVRTSVRNTSMIVSNVQGPAYELSLAGRKMNFMVFWPPCKDHIGCSISIMSYNGSVYMGVLSDVNITEHPEEIIEDLPSIIVSLAESSGYKRLNDSD